MTTRRPKFRRVPQREAIQIMARCRDIFRLLHTVPYMRSSFIVPLVGGSAQKVTKRLGQLYHGCQPRADYPHRYWLDRPEAQRYDEHARYNHAIYSNTKRAREELDGLPPRALNLNVSRVQFPHAMMICDVLGSILLGLKADSTARLITADEIVERMPAHNHRNPFLVPVGDVAFERHRAEKVAILPDAVFGLEYTRDGAKKYVCFFVEAERGNPVMSMKGWLKKYLAYRKMNLDGICKRHFGISAFFVLNITTNHGRIRSMQEAVMRVTNGRGSTQQLFKAIAARPEPTAEFYTGAWKRAGAPDLFINEL